MRRRIGISIFLAVIVMVWAPGARTQTIIGSEHDFSGETWSSGRICAPCHTPHNAMTITVPLWNHESTIATFTLYSSDTLDATMGQPAGASKACLSCHDGTVALDSFGGNTGNEYIEGSARIGTDLGDDHPISFTYDAALAAGDGGLRDPTTSNSGLGNTVDEDMLLAHKMECSSCHNPHNESGLDHLLVKSNQGSALCLTCHDK